MHRSHGGPVKHAARHHPQEFLIRVWSGAQEFTVSPTPWRYRCCGLEAAFKEPLRGAVKTKIHYLVARSCSAQTQLVKEDTLESGLE